MAVGVAGLAFRRVAEVAGDLRVSLHVGILREVEVAAVRHRLAAERLLEVVVGLGAFELLRHGIDLSWGWWFRWGWEIVTGVGSGDAQRALPFGGAQAEQRPVIWTVTASARKPFSELGGSTASRSAS